MSTTPTSTPTSTPPPTTEVELNNTLVPTLNSIYSTQDELNATFSPESIQDIIYHSLKYPTQICCGLMIGQFIEFKLNIVEVVPISHTTQISPLVFDSAIEITNMRFSKTSSFETFKEEMSTAMTAPGGSNGGGMIGMANSFMGGPTNINQTQQGLTLGSFMDEVEKMVKNDQKMRDSFITNNKNDENVNMIGLGSLSPNRDNQVDEKNEHLDKFICGLYICPSPAPKVSNHTLKILTEPNDINYPIAKQNYLHAALKTIPFIFLKLLFDLIMHCPNPLLTILDPILLNINTETYNQSVLSTTTTTTTTTTTSTTTPFCPPLPTFTTYHIHDDVLMSATIDDLMGDRTPAQVLFLDVLDNNIEEQSKYPMITRLNASIWAEIMAGVQQSKYFGLIDWQETVTE
jgi:hypothetical protein